MPHWLHMIFFNEEIRIFQSLMEYIWTGMTHRSGNTFFIKIGCCRFMRRLVEKCFVIWDSTTHPLVKPLWITLERFHSKVWESDSRTCPALPIPSYPSRHTRAISNLVEETNLDCSLKTDKGFLYFRTFLQSSKKCNKFLNYNLIKNSLHGTIWILTKYL